MTLPMIVAVSAVAVAAITVLTLIAIEVGAWLGDRREHTTTTEEDRHAATAE